MDAPQSKDDLPPLTEGQHALRARIEQNDPTVTAEEYDTFVLSRGRDEFACRVRDLVGEIRCHEHIEHVLEIAMGTGISSNRLRELRGLLLFGVDVRADWIQFAVERDRIESSRAVVGNFEQLPVESAQFDLCTGTAFLHHRKHIDRFYSEMRRVLKHSGALLLPWVKPKPGSLERETEYMIEHGFRVVRSEAWYLLARKA